MIIYHRMFAVFTINKITVALRMNGSKEQEQVSISCIVSPLCEIASRTSVIK